jgi:hypothetical protein
MLPSGTIESIQYFTARVSARPYNQSAPVVIKMGQTRQLHRLGTDIPIAPARAS